MAKIENHKQQPSRKSLEPNQPRRGALRGVSANATKRTGRPDGMGVDHRGYEHVDSPNGTDRTGGRPSIPNVRETPNTRVVDRGLPTKVTKVGITHGIR